MIPIDHDLHVHTYLSACCRDKDTQTPRNILAVAQEMGVHTIGFADHIWENTQVEPSGWYRPQDGRHITRLRNDLASVSCPVRVLVGCEADTVAPGKFSITREFAQSLDYVGLSCSHFHMKGFVQQPRDSSPRAVGEHMLSFFLSAAQSGLATTIVHPFMPLGYLDSYAAAIAALSDSELRDAFAVAAGQNVAVEITTVFLPPRAAGGDPAAVWGIETPVRVLSLAKEAGCRFSFGSDAHALDEMRRLADLKIFSEQLALTEQDLVPLAVIPQRSR